MKKMWKYTAIVLACVLAFSACGKLDSSKTSGDTAQDQKIQIGMSFDSFVIERWQRDRDISSYPLRRNWGRRSMCRMPMEIWNSRRNRSTIL